MNILRRLKYRLSRTNLLDHFLNIPVNYGITVGLEIHKNWNNLNWKLPGLLQGGLPIFTKTEISYIETGWELLSVRRKRRKVQLFIT